MNGCVQYAVTKCTNKEELTGDLASDNHRDYTDKHGNEATMDKSNLSTKDLQTSQAFAEQSTVQLVDNFEVGQIVIIDPPSDRPDKRLVGFKSQQAVITKINANSVNLRVWGNILNTVAVQDIKPIDEFDDFNFCNSVNQAIGAFLMTQFDSPSQMISFVLKEKGFYEQSTN